MGELESVLSGTMKDGRRITVWAWGRVVRRDFYWKVVE